MILYHGTYTNFDSIELDKCRPFKDFGKGFYLTDLEVQAMKMAVKKSKIFNGSPVILKYEFDETLLNNGKLKVKIFTKPDREWQNSYTKTGVEQVTTITTMILSPDRLQMMVWLISLTDMKKVLSLWNNLPKNWNSRI